MSIVELILAMNNRGSVSILEGIVVGLVLLAGLGTLSYTQSNKQSNPNNIVPTVAPDASGTKKSLQLETFFISPDPTTIAFNYEQAKTTFQSSGQGEGWAPFGGGTSKSFVWTGDSCEPDSEVDGTCTCPPYQETDIFCPNDGSCGTNGGFSFGSMCIYDEPRSAGYKANLTNANCSIQCNSKPVIYLYPEKPTLVDVRLDIPGTVFISDPLYPEGGWKNVLAHPDGTLIYQSKKYHELYYETATIKANPPTEGFYIARSELLPRLKEYTTKLGLNAFEQKEFLDYWVPSLEKLNSPYIFFSVYSNSEKERVDHVVIDPIPSTTIAFLAYFKPVGKPGDAKPLTFPSVPERRGFTMVEWGGTIDN